MSGKQIIAVIGGGQMGRALVGGMLTRDVVMPSDLRLVDPSEASRQWWAQNHADVVVTDSASAVGDASVVLVAVKPNVVAAVAKQSAKLWRGKLIISIAAGIGLRQLGSWFGHDTVVRVMPNTPSLVGAGASAYCCGTGVTAEHLPVIGPPLANGGVNPRTGERVVSAAHARGVLSAMVTAGMYDDSGPWFYRTGLPAKSGVGGGVVAIVPGRFAIAVYSPPLDERGNSVRATKVVRDLAARWRLHAFESAGR